MISRTDSPAVEACNIAAVAVAYGAGVWWIDRLPVSPGVWAGVGLGLVALAALALWRKRETAPRGAVVVDARALFASRARGATVAA